MNKRTKQFDLKSFLVKYALFILIILLWVFYGTQSKHFFTIRNLRSLITNAAPLIIYATGMTFILILGEIDLSVGSVGALGAAVWMLSMTVFNAPLIVAFLLSLVVGFICGALTGLMVVKLRINAFMVSLGMQFALRGVTYLICGGEQILTPKVVHKFAKLRFLGISPLVYIALVIAVLMMLLYKYSAFGRRVQACGCNRAAAKTVGINVDKTRLLVFIISGTLAGFAGTLQCTNFGILLPGSIGEGSEFLAITACILGGTSLSGGVGTIVPGTLIGVIFYYSIENGLGLLGANVYLYPIVRGLVIYLAMVMDSLKRSIGTKK